MNGVVRFGKVDRAYIERDSFLPRHETRGGHVYNRREEDVEREGREHAPLMKALFHGKPPRAHPVVELHAGSHARMPSWN